jgi:putative PEP-CTERM system TPR-repeat lipoprotein
MRLLKYRVSILIPFFFALGCGKISIDDQLKNAELEYKENNYKTVIIQMKNLIKEQPENKDARLLLANSSYELGLFLDAEKEYLKAQELGVNFDQITTNYIKSLHGSEDYLGIINFWEENVNKLTNLQKAEISPVLSIAYLNQSKFQTSYDIAISGEELAQASNIEKLISINTAFANTYNKSSDLTQKIDELTAVCNKYPTDWVTCTLLANSLFSNKQFTQAAVTFEKILQTKPNYNQLVFKLADSHVRADNYALAQPYISSLLRTFPQQPYINLLAATLEMNNENYSQALIHINTTLNQNYKGPQARLIAGIIHYQLGNFEQANSQLRGLINNYQNNPVINKLYIATQLKLGNSDALFSAANQADPSKDNSELFVNISLELLNLGEEQKSLDILSTIDTSLIENQKVLQSISVMKLKSGDMSGINDLEKALNQSLNGNASEEEISDNKLLFISSLIAMSDIDKAQKNISSWIELSPNNIENYQLLAEIEKQKKPISIKKLDEIYTFIISKDEKNVNANIYFGSTALNNKNYSLAQKHYKVAFTQNNTNINALKGLFVANKNLNQQVITTQLVESVLAGYSTNLQERLVLSQFYLISDQPEKTINLLKNITFNSNIDKNEVNLVLGEAFFQSKQYKQAINLYKSMLIESSENVIAIEKILFAYRKDNDLNGAILTFEELNRKYPNDLQIGLALASIYIYTDKKNESLTFINSLAQEQQQHPIVKGIKGKALYYIKQYQQALDELIISYEQLPDSKTIRFIFDSYIKLNKSNEALGNMGSHIKNYPNDLINRVYYANELAKDNKSKAIEQYKYIIDKGMKNVIVLNNLAWLLMDSGNLREAKEYIDLAIQYFPKNIEVIDTYNQIDNALKN